MKYVESEQNFFRHFIENGNVVAYVERKSKDGVWGDDIEIQALSEIYDLPISIFAYSSKPMKTFHESEDASDDVIRLSYHGKSHYNCILVQTAASGASKSLLDPSKAGNVEEEALNFSRERNQNEEQKDDTQPVPTLNRPPLVPALATMDP